MRIRRRQVLEPKYSFGRKSWVYRNLVDKPDNGVLEFLAGGGDGFGEFYEGRVVAEGEAKNAFTGTDEAADGLDHDEEEAELREGGHEVLPLLAAEFLI